jgi:translation initiation factor IF-3
MRSINITTNKLKQIKLRCNIAENDLNTKIRQIQKFVEKQLQVKVIMEYKGREISYPHLGRNVLEKIAASLGKTASCTIQDKLKNHQLIMSIQPKKVVYEN